MGFLGIGTWEILLILILALIILGPSKLTEFARTLGKTVRAIRKASADLTTAVTREINATQNEPASSQPKEESRTETGEAPSAINKANKPSRDDQPTKPGGASATK
jgi:sec-independent protein translocase protein TatB